MGGPLAEFEKVRELTGEEAAKFQAMLAKIQRHASRNRLRSALEGAKKRLDDVGFSIPENALSWQVPVGWGEKTITVPASRIRPEGFTTSLVSNPFGDLQELAETHFHQALERRWSRSSMLHGVSFAFVVPSAVAGDPPIRFVKSAIEATAITDPRTDEVLAALELLSRTNANLYMPGYTVEVALLDGAWVAVSANHIGVKGLVPCTPQAWARTTERPFGRSRITRPLMGFMDQAVRTMLRQETNAEFYSAPQRALMGADEIHFTGPDGQKISPLEALIGGIWALPDVYDEDEQRNIRPELKQLQQATMQPHVDMLRSIASMVASETTIPINYLGVVHDQPASAEAILAAESDMVAMLEAELPEIGAARTDFAGKVWAMETGEHTPAMRKDLRSLKARFRDPGTPTLAARADAGGKYVTAFPEGDPEVAMEVYGLRPDQIARNLAHSKRASAASAIDALIQATPTQVEP